MSNRRTHYVTTTDGVTIGGTVHGEGPPLVFVPGILGDGDSDWQPLVGHLTDRFTCHLLSYRGAGLSGEHPDLSLGRMADDILTYVDSIEEPTGLVGWSAGASLSLLAAGVQPDAVTAVASFEPGVFSLMDEHQQEALGGAVARMAALAAEGRLPDAARALVSFFFTEEDMAVAEDADYFEATGRYVPNVLNFLQQQQGYEGPTPEHPAVLGAISAPVLVLQGADTTPFLAASARYVADHVPNARIHVIPGAGHTAQWTHPEAFAGALTAFFSPAQQPA